MKVLPTRRPAVLLAAFVVAVVVLMMGGAGAVSAQTLLPPISCPTNFNSCTANDLVTTVSNAIPVNGDSCVDPSDTITVDLYVNWEPNAGTRYDVGFWISTDGGPVNNGAACVGSVAPIGAGTLPNVFTNEDNPPQTGDTCGDIKKANSPVVWPVRATLPCTPAPGTNYLQVQACRAWEQNTGITCTNLTDSGTGSKCDCSPLQVTQIAVPSAATIKVVKDLVPDSDTGLFNLFVDKLNDGSIDQQIANVGDGGTLGPFTVPAGTNLNPGATHKIGETAGTNTSLATYTSSITCVRAGGGAGSTVGPVAATSLLLTVQPNDNWTCTITNSTAYITVDKVTFPANAGYGFEFNVSPAADTNQATSFMMQDTTPAKELRVKPSATGYTVAETLDPAVQGWTLIDATCTLRGTSTVVGVENLDFGNGTGGVSGVTVSAGQVVDCVFTNEAGPLDVNLASFVAQPFGSRVMLSWETVSEQDSAGFNLYRGQSEAGPWQKINVRLIPSRAPGGTSGAAYNFIDHRPLKGANTWYMLEDVALNGTLTQHTPVSVDGTAPSKATSSAFDVTRASAAWVAVPLLFFGLLGFALGQNALRRNE